MSVSPHPECLTAIPWDTHNLLTSAEEELTSEDDSSPFQPRNRDETRLFSQTRQREPQPDSQDTYAGMAVSKNWYWILGLGTLWRVQLSLGMSSVPRVAYSSTHPLLQNVADGLLVFSSTHSDSPSLLLTQSTARLMLRLWLICKDYL